MEQRRNLQLEEGMSMCGLYATSGSGVYKAGKRKGLLWKEIDDGTADMWPHISSVFNVLRLVFFWTAVLAFLLTKGK